MKLVLTYDISDHCTYSYETHIPFEYESKEKAEYDLYEEWLRMGREFNEYVKWQESRPHESAKEVTLKKWNESEPKLNPKIKLGTIFDLEGSSFTVFTYDNNKPRKYDQPKIQTLEEWFEAYKE